MSQLVAPPEERASSDLGHTPPRLQQFCGLDHCAGVPREPRPLPNFGSVEEIKP